MKSVLKLLSGLLHGESVLFPLFFVSYMGLSLPRANFVLLLYLCPGAMQDCQYETVIDLCNAHLKHSTESQIEVKVGGVYLEFSNRFLYFSDLPLSFLRL